jgi:hypothetical protein
MVTVNIRKKDLWLFAAVMVFMVGVSYVVAVWTPSSHLAYHDSNDVKVRISGTDYSLQEAINAGLIGGGGATPIPTPTPSVYKQYYLVSTKYSVLMANETFRAWLNSTGGGIGWPISGGNDHGWYIRADNLRFRSTANKLCEYFMGSSAVADFLPRRYSGGDYGSDNNNLAYYWNATSNSWGAESHGDNGNIDITALRCIGPGFLDRAIPFLA